MMSAIVAGYLVGVLMVLAMARSVETATTLRLLRGGPQADAQHIDAGHRHAERA